MGTTERSAQGDPGAGRPPADLERDVVAALRTCYDPEIPVDIYELGLIYDVAVAPPGSVAIRMTLTSPNCPAAQELPAQVTERVRAVPGVTDARVEIVFDPPWCTDRMSEAARLQLGLL
jgi:FeS assembly SUF system protein